MREAYLAVLTNVAYVAHVAARVSIMCLSCVARCLSARKVNIRVAGLEQASQRVRKGVLTDKH